MSGAPAHSTGDHRQDNVLRNFRGDLSLEEEFEHALEIEEHKKNVNDAKLRAVEQRVPTYDGFHQAVLGADLKPLERKDRGKLSLFEGLTNSNRTLYGSDMTSGGYGDDNAAGVLAPKEVPTEAPTTAMQFLQDWKRCCSTPEKKFQYLSLLPNDPAAWAALFKVGLETGLLTEVLNTFRSEWKVADSSVLLVLAAMVGLGQTPRFALTLDLLSTGELDTLKSLCSDLQATAAAQAGCAGLAGEFEEMFAKFLPGGEPVPDMSAYE